jgi:serine/threonine protein kinase
MTSEHIGRVIGGRYRLISRLAEGGMGVTYRAWDSVQAVPVVVKMPKRDAHSGQAALRRFAREIDAMLALPHKHIVPITDHGQEDGCPYVVMRFLPGGSLADHRRRDNAGNLLANAAGMLHVWLPAVAEALDSIHKKGVLHRDVKPGNVFFDGFWNAFLGDFGIAKVVDSSAGIAKEDTLTATMMAIGTPEYMAPELFSPSGKPDGRADQYALAVTVYEMLSGVRPFTGEKAHIVVEQCGMPVPPLQAKQLGIPRSLCIAVERALAKTPQERFSTCSDFARAALLEVDTLPAEPATARLMCPSCKKILKLPASAGGQWGRCPKCKVAMRVAPGLTALWLRDEEVGVSSASRSITRGEVTKELSEIPSGRARQMWPARPSIAWLSAAIVSALSLLLVGYLFLDHAPDEEAGQHQETVVEATGSSVLSGTDSKPVTPDNSQVDADRLQLAAENERLKAELALVEQSKTRQVAPGAIDEKSHSTQVRKVIGEKENPEPRSSAGEEVARSVPQVIWDYGDVVTFTGGSLETQVAQDLAGRSGSLRLRPASNQLSLSRQAATSLARHKGRTILFAGTTALSRDAAQAIAMYPNILAFEHLAPLTPEVASALATRTGGLYVGGCDQEAWKSATAKLQGGKGRVVVPSRSAAAIEKASKYLLSQQREDGSWEAMRSADKRAGATALVMLALANAGMTAEQPAMRRALSWLRRQEPNETYFVALQTMMLALLTPRADRAILERNVEWLERAQIKQGPDAGSWTYGQANGAGKGDNSNSQYAVLALHEADRVGVRTRSDVWTRTQKYWTSYANEDGSWGYTRANANGTGSMTCAGVVSLRLASNHLGIANARENAGIIACCRGASPPEVPAGLRWLESKFTVSQNPGTGGETWLYYYLAGLSRVRRFTGQRFVHDGSSAQLFDSAQMSAEMLWKTQDPLSGKFVANRIEDSIVATSMAVIVLADCSKPPLIAKSVHEPVAECDCHGRDVACLVDAINVRSSLAGNASYSWHRIPVAAATESQLAESPLLVISGRESFDLGENAAARLRRYTDNGGVVFAEPSCGESSKFDKCLRDLVAKMFPEEELALNGVPDGHRLWGSGVTSAPDDRPRLLGIEHRGRLRVIYHPLQSQSERSLSCLWELSHATASLSVANRGKVTAAVEFGKSLAMYAAATCSRLSAYDLANIRTQGKLQRCMRPASRADAKTSGSAVGTADGQVESLSQAWNAYESRCDLDLARIEGQIKTTIAEQGSHLRLEVLLELENAVEVIRGASLLPVMSAAGGYDVDAVMQIARVNEAAASRALWDAYNAAIQEASHNSENGNGARSLVRERDEVFKGLGLSPSEAEVFGAPGEEGSLEPSSAGGEAKPATGGAQTAAEPPSRAR